jgi:hypothetical protein
MNTKNTLSLRLRQAVPLLGLFFSIGCSKASAEDTFATVGFDEGAFGKKAVTVCLRGTTYTFPAEVAEGFLNGGAYRGPCADYGDRTTLGDGYARTYVQLDDNGSPWAIGVEFSESMLSNLPTNPAFDGNNCWDVDGNGTLNITMHPHECAGGHQRILFMPPTAGETPFKWVLLNWNPHGHDPQGIYSVPHFDFHFYIMDYLKRNYIRPGPCGLLVNCDDFNRGIMPVPSKYLHPDYDNRNVVEARMGNHLVDLTSPEFQPGSSFSHTLIVGAYDSHVTFLEPMITVSFLQSQPDVCTPIKLPAAYEVAGYYPTQYCIRYRASRQEYAISLEGFVNRPASP